MEGRFIVVEGFDGSGKSSIAKFIAEKYGYLYMKTPMNAFARARECFDDSSNLLERLSFYAGSCISASLAIEQLRRDNISVVLDRYYYSTIAYHESKLGYIPKIIQDTLQNLFKPDLILLVKTNFSLTLERLAQRGMSMNDSLFLNNEYYEKIHYNYLNLFDAQHCLLDNSSDLKTLEKNVHSIMQKLK